MLIPYRGKQLTESFPASELFIASTAMWIATTPTAADPALRDAWLGKIG